MPGKCLLHRGRLIIFDFMYSLGSMFSLIWDPGEVILGLYSAQLSCSSFQFSLFLER